MKVITKAKYDKLIESYKDKYLNDFIKGIEKAGDKNYFISRFKDDVLTKNESRLYPLISAAIQFRNEKKWMENIDTVHALKKYCQLHNQNLSQLLEKTAEYDSISLVWQEVNRHETYNEVKTVNDQTINNIFSLDEKVISKIDFIRIINAIWELKGFLNSNGTIPSKKEIMIFFGKLVGFDLTEYDKDLSSGLRKSLETNIEIFKKMEEKTKSICASKI